MSTYIVHSPCRAAPFRSLGDREIEKEIEVGAKERETGGWVRGGAGYECAAHYPAI